MDLKNYIKNFIPIITDIRFWLFVFFVIRLETINIPPLDEHAWRQCITLGVAKNYLEVDATFYEPKTVICDSREGILAQEFPILNYLIFILWKIFGLHNWIFRLLVLTVSTAGLFYYYHLIKRLFNHNVSQAATIVFSVSVAFMYARKAMPDVFAISLCIIAIEFGYRYLESKKIKDLLIFIVLLTLGLLSKMPAAVVIPLGLHLIQWQWVHILEWKFCSVLHGDLVLYLGSLGCRKVPIPSFLSNVF
jgi:Dolichyl-phosphate-mannose-protein mannosyltransferase